MGNAATAIGDNMSCFRNHQNTGSVQATLASGKDLDDAVLASVSNSIDAAASGLANIIQLSFKCRNLPNLDTFTRTDGMVVLFRKQGNQWAKLGMTEVIMDTLNPDWVKAFDVQYNFEKRETYKVEVYDVDDFNNVQNFKNHDHVGTLEFTLHEVVTGRDQAIERPLINNTRAAGKSGTIIITGEEKTRSSGEEIIFKPRATLANGSGMCFIIVMKQIGANNWKPIYKSEIKPATQGAFNWNNVACLCADLVTDGNIDQDFRIEFYRNEKSGKHKNLGSATMNIAQLKDGARQIPVMDKKGKANKGSFLDFTHLEFFKRASFLEYVFGGCEIGLSIAIDFTLSNGAPTKHDSLHRMNTNNEYVRAIEQVGNILQYYDADKQIPVYGFGAAIPPMHKEANHCFALNGDIFNPECDGIEGVLQAYKDAIKTVNLYGPTHFSRILETVNDMTEAMQVNQINQKYNILLIITDGIINDMQKTIDQIVRGSVLPLSIIIVGVGNADFDPMDVLDADDEPLYSQRFKKYMAADIVQFVPFREFANDPMALARETLTEVPGQLVNFMRNNSITPNPATEAQRRALQSKLSKQNSMGQGTGNPHDVPLDEFFEKQKEKMIERAQEMGYDPFAVKDFIEEKGMVSLNEDLIVRFHQDPTYRNPLKKNKPKPIVPQQQMQQQQQFMQQPGQFNYGYTANPVQGQPPMMQGQTPMMQGAPTGVPVLPPIQQQQPQQVPQQWYMPPQPQDNARI